MSKIPAIRFKPFSKDWEKDTLSRNTERIVRKNEHLESSLPLTVSAQYGLIAQNKFFNSKIASSNLRGYYLVKNGEFAYNKSSSQDYPFGAIKRLDEYEQGVLSTLYIVFALAPEINSDYMVSYFDSPKWHDEVRKKACEGARNHGLLNISASDFLSMGMYIPSSDDEQERIGCFFKNLDVLIKRVTDELETLKKMKQASLQTMFPSNSDNIPKIRFNEFEKRWDDVKLGEIAERVTSKNSDKLITEVLTNSAVKGLICQRDYFDHDIAKKENTGGYYIVQPDDFVYNPRVSVSAPVGPINRNKLGKVGIVSPLYNVFCVHDVNKVFLEYYFKTSYWFTYMRYNGNTGARYDRFSISESDFFNMPIPVPDKDEQEKIARYFEDLDSMIYLKDKELQHLMHIKTSCLDGMFVNP